MSDPEIAMPAAETAEKAPSESPAGPEPWEVRYLEPGSVRFFTREGDPRIHLADEDRTHLDVRVRRCFPQSLPDRYLSVMNRRNEEIGVVRDPTAFCAEELRLIRRGLELAYFVPIITKIMLADDKAGIVYCEVETDRGYSEFAISDPRQNVANPEPNRFVIQDVHGNRYEIPDVSQLDAKSQLNATALL